jgi:hypothetical protein
MVEESYKSVETKTLHETFFKEEDVLYRKMTTVGHTNLF